jgi:hypothetical protein
MNKGESVGRAPVFRTVGDRLFTTVVASRRLPDGRALDLELLLFGQARLCVGPLASVHYETTWDYEDRSMAFAAFLAWDGAGEPEGWTRHRDEAAPRIRYRPHGDPGREWVKEEP